MLEKKRDQNILQKGIRARVEYEVESISFAHRVRA